MTIEAEEVVEAAAEIKTSQHTYRINEKSFTTADYPSVISFTGFLQVIRYKLPYFTTKLLFT